MSSRMVSLLASLEGVQQAGEQVTAKCPAHVDRSNSLGVGVGASGKVLLSCYAGCSFGEIAAALGGPDLSGTDWAWPADMSLSVSDAGAAVRPDSDVALLRSFVAECEAALWDSPKALAHVRSRFGLSDALIRGFRLGLSQAGAHSWDAVGPTFSAVPRLVVPFFGFDGSLGGLQGRALADHRVRWSGLTGSGWLRSSMFRPDLFDDTGKDEVVITEGPGDALTVAALGYTAVAIRGAGLRSKSTLDEFSAALAGRTVCVAGDADAAGEKFTTSVVQALLAEGLDARVLGIRQGGDLNDWAQAGGSFFGEDFADAVGLAPAPILAIEKAAAVRAAAPNVFDSWVSSEAPGVENVTAAATVLWFIRQTGRDACSVAGFEGPTLFADGLWRLGLPLAVRACLQEAGAAARSHNDLGHQHADKISLFGHRMASTAFLNNVLTELTALLPTFEADEFDAAEHLLSCANGVVDLRTGELTPTLPKHMMSARLETAYDPEADCDLWVQFLADVMMEERNGPMSCFLQRCAGYGASGSTAEQCILINVGYGANGKTVYAEVLTHVFRAITKTVPFSVFEDSASTSGGPSSEIARLRGARMVFTEEGSGKPMKEALLKLLTGSSTVVARGLYQSEFEFSPRFLISMATNHKPSFKGIDEGLWRRVKLVEWRRYFEPAERDRRLSSKLMAESAGILAWAVRGAMLWYAEDSLREPESVTVATEEYRDASDILASFYPGVLVNDFDEGSATLTEIYFAFVFWADSNGIENYSRRWLRSNLETRGVVFKRTNKGQTAMGVKLV